MSLRALRENIQLPQPSPQFFTRPIIHPRPRPRPRELRLDRVGPTSPKARPASRAGLRSSPRYWLRARHSRSRAFRYPGSRLVGARVDPGTGPGPDHSHRSTITGDDHGLRFRSSQTHIPTNPHTSPLFPLCLCALCGLSPEIELTMISNRIASQPQLKT
jgi:hypothetical protein